MERKRKKVTALVNSKSSLWGQEKGVYFVWVFPKGKGQ